MSVNLFSVLDVFEKSLFYICNKVCVCVCFHACCIFSIIKPFISAYVCVCVCVCLYAYCLLSIFKPFISVCVCMCVSVSLLSIFDEFHCQLCIQLCWPRP